MNLYIQKWDVVNICDPEVFTCSFLEKNVLCNKPAKFRKDDKCFCLKHSKKQNYQILKALNRNEIDPTGKFLELRDIAAKTLAKGKSMEKILRK